MTDLSRIFHKDQADELRRMVTDKKTKQKQARAFSNLHSIAVVGGKGGIGKSNVSVNLALALGDLGKNVVLMDGDLGLANIDILLGVTPPYNLIHLVRGEKNLDDILFDIGERVKLIPGGSGIEELANLNESEQSLLIDRLSMLEEWADIVVVDTGAGIHKNVISFGLAVDTAILVTTPEPTSIRDAYGLLKSLVSRAGRKLDVRILVNMVSDKEEALNVSNRVLFAAKQFLRTHVSYLGFIPIDYSIVEAVKARTPVLKMFPETMASLCIEKIARSVLSNEYEDQDNLCGRGVKSFLFRFVRRFGMKDDPEGD